MSETTEHRNDSVWDWGLTEFRDRTAAATPTPGGGSAAMVGAAIGMGLVLMALRVTQAKADRPEALAPLIASGDGLMAELSAHADADIAVFETYMEALRLPKGTEDEKAARRTALAAAGQAATEVPLNAAQSCLEALDVARQAAPLASSTIVSDVAAGALMIHAGLAAMLLTVDINLKSLKDAALRDSYLTSRRHLEAGGQNRRDTIVALTSERIAAG